MGGDYHINSCWRALQRDRTSHTKTLGERRKGKRGEGCGGVGREEEKKDGILE